MTARWLVLAPICLIAIALGGASAGVSADAAKTDSSRKGEGLAEAKNDFDALKASRNAGLGPKEELPRLNAPEWYGTGSSTTSPARAGNTAPKKSSAEKKSANWLVDAMQKPTERRDARGLNGSESARDSRESLTGTDEISFSDPVEAGSDPKSSTSAPAAKTESRPPPKEPVVNPLNTYLGDWMTPQDYALLKPGLSSTSDALLPSPATSMPGVGAATAAPNAGLSLPVPGISAPGPTISLTPRDNPYLQPLGLPSPAGLSAPVAAPVLPAPAPMMTSTPQISPPPVLSAPAPSRIPDFARPADDEKYFKQLKRF